MAEITPLDEITPVCPIKVEVHYFAKHFPLSSSLSSLLRSVIQADVCVCTLPLGVLKESIKDDNERSESDRFVPRFDPPLPESNKAAIRRLGFGCLNKVI